MGEATSGRAMLAKVTALRSLDRIRARQDGPMGAQITRLLDGRRDPGELVRDDDWHPGPAGFHELDACHTLGTRRRWYASLHMEGRI
jgi:hypothetical protein